VRRVFEDANSRRLPIVVHVRASRASGRQHAEILLNQILPAAPDVVVQVAPFWRGNGFSEPALAAYATALSAHHPATGKLYFDVAELARVIGAQTSNLERATSLMRQIGLDRILYGSDGYMFGNSPPAQAWEAFRREVPLTNEEFTAIANNVAPYLR
jgi:hypothetical protein